MTCTVGFVLHLLCVQHLPAYPNYLLSALSPAVLLHRSFESFVRSDLGWYDTAVYNPASPTPRIAELCADGLRLDHHHVFRYCSPTRRSLLSGRFPNHISTAQPDGTNLCSDFLPLNLTTLAEKLKRGANYTNHYVGKGHLGYETMDHLPINRGFDDHVGFLGGSEGYAHGSGDVNPTKGKHDMWHDLGPGIDVVPEMYYSANYYASAISFVEAAGERRRARLARGEQARVSPFSCITRSKMCIRPTLCHQRGDQRLPMCSKYTPWQTAWTRRTRTCLPCSMALSRTSLMR